MHLPRSQTLLPLAAALVVLSTPVATWWALGDLSETTIEPHYLVKPPEISPTVELCLGLVAVVVLVASAVVLLPVGRTALDAAWWWVLGPLVAVGMLGAVGWRVVTAGTGGANIGAGLMIMFAGPLVVLLLAWAVVAAVVLLNRRQVARRRSA